MTKVKQSTKDIGLELEKLHLKGQELDEKYSKALWKEIEPHTKKIEDLPKAVEILNSCYYSVSTFDLFSKLRKIKRELQKKIIIEPVKAKKK